MNDSNKHVPVLLREVLNEIDESTKLFVDVTLGRGGHFIQALDKVDNLLGIDRDIESINYVSKVLLEQGFNHTEGYYTNEVKKVFLKQDNFSNLDSYIKQTFNLVPQVILADLGVSTYQIKSSVQGLSFERPEDKIDMRLDDSINVTAADLLNALSEGELTKLFGNLAGVHNSKTLAKKIVDYRSHKKFETVGDFIKAGGFVKRFGKTHTATKPFMALRIAVNSEHINLKNFLESSLNYVQLGTKLLIITFHSLEEKQVYKFAKLNGLNITKIAPSSKEVLENKSARSANLLIIKND